MADKVHDDERQLIEQALADGKARRVGRKRLERRATPVNWDNVPRIPASQPLKHAPREGVRLLSVQEALEWAFMTELASLDLDDGKAEHQIGVDTVYKLMQRNKLGFVKIEGGGRSFPHDDADLIAAAVTELALIPRRTGLALLVAEAARSGRVPDWMPGATPSLEPAAWRPRRGFAPIPMAETEVLRRYHVETQHPHPKNPERSITRRRKVEEEWCPITWALHPQEIRSARRTYAQWVVALEWIRQRLVKAGDLESIELTSELPSPRPWNK